MNVFEFLAIAILILSLCAVVVVDKALGFSRRTHEQRANLAEQHAHHLTQRVNELERHNDELRQQLEWNRRLLEAQDRVIEQFGQGSPRVELAASTGATAQAVARV